MATHSSTFAWKIPCTEEPGGLQSMGSQRVWYNWTTSLSLSFGVKKLSFFPFPSFSCPSFSLFSLLHPFLQSLFSVITFFLFPTTHLPASIPWNLFVQKKHQKGLWFDRFTSPSQPKQIPLVQGWKVPDWELSSVMELNSDYLDFQREFGYIRTV